MNVAGYVRVSTEQQRDSGSHDRQRQRLEDWADRNDYEIEIFQDIAISGKADERTAYDELMERALAGEFDVVAVRDLSRFGRSLQQVLGDIDELKTNDVDFISVNENFDTSSALGTAMMQMIGVFNEFWSNLASERAMENVERRRERGDPIGRPKKLNEKQIEMCREWHSKGMSYATVARLAEMEFGVEISRQTARRYCQGDD